MTEEIKVVMYGRVGSKEYLDNLLEWEEKQSTNHPDWQVCKSFYDYGSGLKIQPKLKQLLAYVKNEKIDALVVANGSRLIRRADLFIQIIASLRKEGVHIYFTDEDVWLDDENVFVQMLKKMLIMEIESRQMSERIKYGMKVYRNK